MTWLSAIIMGLVQGIAEFLPISSSGHLAIAEHLLNMQGASEIPQFYDVLLHLGTLVAVFIAYWDEIYDMIVEFFAGVGDLVHHTTPRVVPPAWRMILLVIVGTLPLFVMVPFRHFFEGLSDNMYFIGVSRSGMTITTGCFVGFERKFAVRFSFILSIPAILGANILSIKDAVDAGINWSEMPMYLIGVAVAAVTGYLCIRLLKMIADRGRFGAFAYYCWTVGALVLIFTIV